MAVPRPITFLSDYGYDDEFAGVCRAVISGIAPDARVIDLTHGVARQDVRSGALALARALPFCPPGVHLAVVDPGVGTSRRAIAATTGAAEGERVLVGPDNGLLWPALERFGGAAAAVSLEGSRYNLEPVSASFHGRDVFAPVSAHLSLGAPLADVGEPIDPSGLTRLELPPHTVGAGGIIARALSIDAFGNVALNVGATEADGPLPAEGQVAVRTTSGSWMAVRGVTFADADPGGLVLYEDSSGALALAVNGGAAAELLGLAPGAEVRLEPA